jgi:hypothetical protein
MIILNLKERQAKLELAEQVDYLAELAAKYPNHFNRRRYGRK